MSVSAPPAADGVDACCGEGCCGEGEPSLEPIEYVIGDCIPDGEGGCQRSSRGNTGCCTPAKTTSTGLCCDGAAVGSDGGHGSCLSYREKDDKGCGQGCCEGTTEKEKEECCPSSDECTHEEDAKLGVAFTDAAAVVDCCPGDSHVPATSAHAHHAIRRRLVRVKSSHQHGKDSKSPQSDKHAHKHTHKHRHSCAETQCGMENTFGRFFEAACCCLIDWTRANHRHHHPNRDNLATTRTRPSAPPARPGSLNIAQVERGGGSTRTMVMSVQGMDCPSCAGKVTRALLTLPSVGDVKVNSITDQATLTYTEGLIFPADIAKRATELTGFTCHVLEEAQPEGRRRIMHIGVSLTAEGIHSWEDKGVRLPPGVSIKNVNSRLIVVEFDPAIIKPRDVLAVFASSNGTFVPLPRLTNNAPSRELISLFYRTLISSVLCIPVLVFSWAPIPRHPIAYGACSLVLTTGIQSYVAAPIYSAALRSLFLQHILDMDLLVILSSSIAYIFSLIAYFTLVSGHAFSDPFFETPALLITLITLGRLISAFARRRATSVLNDVRSLQADTVSLVDASGSITTLFADLVHVNDVLLISPDTLVPTDGVVIKGYSQIDESSITGESIPVDKAVGSKVIAGTLNGSGLLHMKVERVPADNTIADIGKLLLEVQDAHLPVQDLADQVASYLAPVILVTSSVVFAIWMAIGVKVRNESASKAAIAALQYAIAVLVISCPCALVLCVPMVVVISAAVSGKHGVLFKSVQAIQYAKDVKVAIFDKTGTLTTGKLEVVQTHVEGSDGHAIASALASFSRHPVAQSVANYLSVSHPEDVSAEIKDAQSIPGCGVEAHYGGRVVRGGSPVWLGIETHPAVIDMFSRALTIFAVTCDGEVLAIFGLSDTVRPSARDAIQALKEHNCEAYIVSGDAQPVVSALAARLGIPVEHAFGGCLPQTKLERLRSLQGSGKDAKRTMFIGDGTNDSLALAQADIGISLGTGTDIALSSADVVILEAEHGTDLARAVRVVMGVSRAAVRRIIVNFAWAFLYNTVAVLFAAGAFVKVRVAPQYAGLGEMVSVVPVVLVAWSMWLAKW